MATFIHTADWGLGGSPADVSDENRREFLRSLRFQTVRRIGEIARERGAEFVLVVGDVFDTASPNHATIAEAIREIASIDLPVLIVPGRLDGGAAGSVWTQDFFVRQANEHAPNLRVLLTGDPVEQGGCLLFPAFVPSTCTDTRDAVAQARVRITPDDRRPRIVVVSAPQEGDDPSSHPRTVVAEGDIDGIDYVAAVDGDSVGQIAVVTVRRGEPPVVDPIPSNSVHAFAEDRYCPAEPTPPPPTDDNVQFTVYRPQVVAPAKWYDLVAAAHLDAARPEADPAEPSPLDRVRRKAEAILGDRFDDYAPLTQDALQGVPQGSELTFAFEMPGVEFNPARVSFGWWEDEHTVQVRLRASPTLEGKTARGRMTVFLGAIILADVPFSLRVDSSRAADRPRLEPEREAVRRYRRIFASYSHRDLPIVEQFEAFVEATGDRYLRDHKVLRAGEAWDDRLLELIAEADVFQLFWSRNALASPHVRREWEHALSLGRENFIRPVYWESPLPQAHGLPPEPLTRIHFQFLGGIATTGVECDAAAGEDEETAADAEAVEDFGWENHADFFEEQWESVAFDCALPPAEYRPTAAPPRSEAVAVQDIHPATESHPDSRHSVGLGRGLLLGFGVGMIVVPILIWLIASLLSLL